MSDLNKFEQKVLASGEGSPTTRGCALVVFGVFVAPLILATLLFPDWSSEEQESIAQWVAVVLLYGSTGLYLYVRRKAERNRNQNQNQNP